MLWESKPFHMAVESSFYEENSKLAEVLYEKIFF